MKSPSEKLVRCAIYTRKSTERGLELAFNSLDAQREACEAYIRSQQGLGWKAVPQRYDDPAYSGGSLERPAVQRLLKDIEDGRIDVVVVYKIDRLTRSLADFAKLVDIFDARAISFVAVTQQFNTTTSMGRLTLNVLLSFAQFERELSSERVRDKVAASRKKGKWMGGTPPLGYAVKDKKLIVNQQNADTVRYIFKQYLETRSLQNLILKIDMDKLTRENKSQNNSQKVAKAHFSYGALAYLLKNRVYIGEAGHKGNWHPGEHEAIVDRKLFDGVQLLLKTNSVERKNRRTKNQALLTGKLFDIQGNRFTPSYTIKNGVRYRFYVNSALLRGRPNEAGSIRRISAIELEEMISKTLQNKFNQPNATVSALIEDYIERIILKRNVIEIILMPSKRSPNGDGNILNLRWSHLNKNALATIETDKCAKQAMPDPRSIQAIARSHVWLDLLSTGTFKSVSALAKSIDMDVRSVSNGLRLAFLSPEITQAIFKDSRFVNANLAGIQNELPLSWRQQSNVLKLRTTA